MDAVDSQLTESYRLFGRLSEIVLEPRRTALLMIDMQYLDAHRDGEYGRRARERGIAHQMEYFFQRLEGLAVPNAARLLEVCRRAGVDVVFTRIASLADDGRDLGWRFKEWNLVCGVDSPDARFLPELVPQPNEIVINKTGTSAFLSSQIDTLLRNMGIRYIIVCGVVTHACVETSVRDAADLGYRVLLAEDACAAMSQSAHDNAIRAMGSSHATVMSTDEILAKVERDIVGRSG